MKGMYLTERRALSCTRERTRYSKIIQTPLKYCSHRAWNDPQLHFGAQMGCKNDGFISCTHTITQTSLVFTRDCLKPTGDREEMCRNHQIQVRRFNCYWLLIDQSSSYTHGLFSYGPYLSGTPADAEGKLGEVRPGIRWL